jgi:hypothetical protein
LDKNDEIGIFNDSIGWRTIGEKDFFIGDGLLNLFVGKMRSVRL